MISLLTPAPSRLVVWSLLAMSGMGSVIGAELPNPGMQISRGVEAGNWQLGWHGVKGWTYFLQQSPNALGWSYLPWLASGNDGPLGLTVRSSAGAGFFRWRATDRSVADPWTADFDGDGVGNGDELLQSTDPLSAADADINGLPDDWELFYFQRIGVDPHATAPGGSMTNLQHFTLGSNPHHPPPPPTIIPGPVTLDQNAETPLYPTDDSQLLLKNGNFSQGDSTLPSLGSNSWWPYPSGIPGWTAISGQIVELQQIEVNTTARAGQYGELDAHWPTDDHRGDSDHGIQQTVNLPRGHYLLFFDYRGREHDVDAGSFTVKVKSMESSSDVLLVSKNSASTTAWQRASVSFEIIAGNPNSAALPITLQFDSADARDSFGTYIDNVLLLPVEMMVDANRDGEMSFTEAAIHDKDGTTAKKPYRFWLNNDHDIYHQVDGSDNEWDDASDTATWKDSNYTSIYTMRDLEDFTRLRITLKGITDLIKNTEYSCFLEWRAMDGAQTSLGADGAPEINVYQERQPDVRPLYLEDETVASNQRGSAGGISYDTWIGGTKPGEPMDLFALRPALRTALSESTPTINLLFCGKTAGRGQLILTIKKGTQLIGQYPPVYIELLDIKDMYERWTVDTEPSTLQRGGSVPSATAQLTTKRLPTGYASPSHSRPFAYSASDLEENKYILYVHGWNMTPVEKEQFAETAYKRLFWQGYKGRVGVFEWPTTHSFDPDKNKLDPLVDPTNYDRGEWSSWRSAPPLRNLLAQMNQTYPGQVYVLAHSMGNVVTGEALRLQNQSGGGQIVNTYVASQAALPAHCYDGTIAQGQPLGNELQFFYDHDKVPGSAYDYGPVTPNIYRDWLAPNGGAVGRRVSFRNLNDYALTPEVWQFNQITKPDWRDIPDERYNYFYGGNPEQPPQQTGFYKSEDDLGRGPIYLDLGSAADVKDRYEIMSFAAEPRSKALGGSANVNGWTPFDLQSVWKPDDSAASLRRFGNYSAHKWHSAEFRSTNMRQGDYWKALLGNKGFNINPSPAP